MKLIALKAKKKAAKRRLAKSWLRAESDRDLLGRLGIREDPDSWSETLARFSDPVEIPDLRARAEAVLGGRQLLFGKDLHVGWPPHWNWRWHGTENERFFANDIRSTWEVQRLQGILPLAWAANSLEDRERYAGAYLQALASFASEHPGPQGVAWESALELGLRLVALAQGLPLVARTQSFAKHGAACFRLLDRHTRWLRADLSLDKVVRGNHLLGELAGLFAAGCLVRSAQTAWWQGLPVQDLLEREILLQFHEDGVNVEQSLTYEKFMLEFLLVAAACAAKNGRPFGPKTRERLLRSAAHLEATCAPDGTLPRVGDCDSGKGADWGERDPHRLGDLPRRAREILRGELPEAAVFPQGGHAVIRTETDFLFVRGGPFGWGPPASHSHADWLAPVLTMDGEAVLVDPGVFGYRLDPPLRDAFRVWEAHSAIRLEPSPSPQPVGTFRWSHPGGRASLRGERHAVHGEVAWKALLWQRTMRYNELHRTWDILDRLSDDFQGPAAWAFRFAPEATLEILSERDVAIRLPGGLRLRLQADPAGGLAVEEGWVAPAYGTRRKAPVLVRRLPPGVRESRVTLHRDA